MKKNLILSLIIVLVLSCNSEKRTQNFPKTQVLVSSPPDQEEISVYIMAGQSNMAGRGLVAPKDTIPHERLLTTNAKEQLILAKEPLHWYEPPRTGLDCGLSFGRSLLDGNPNEYILVLPTAIGGSSIQQWINDLEHHDVPLLSNFKNMVRFGKKYGTIKGIIWHQGESDTLKDEDLEKYPERLSVLFQKFRTIIGNDSLPIVLGELGSFNKHNARWQQINKAIHDYTKTDPFSAYIKTQDLQHKGDSIHFDANGQREMGKRFAKKIMALQQ
ncbi:sialate O-acetylesterase [Maribacter algicola]|uniref:Sialate O-acetylesterase n=1 Tax=Meishania litoralis TaxID=3434685 RepID=A0ACC7LR05_9FLAO